MKCMIRYFLVLLFFLTPTLVFANSGIVINEIAWMGTKANSADEWLELYNPTENPINVSGWKLYEGGGQTLIIDFQGAGLKNATIPANGYFLIERSDDKTVSDILADLFGSFSGGGLSNSGEHLVLKNKEGAIIDEINMASGWSAGKASPEEYLSMERIDPSKSGNETTNWASNNTSVTNGTDSAGNTIQGTPKQKNSVQVSVGETFSLGSATSEEENSSTSSGIGQLASQPIQPRFKVDAGKDQTAIAGANVLFHGGALGFKNEPLSGGRFLWNFGDGKTVEGREVIHVYRFSGQYIVSLSVSSDTESESDYSLITVRQNPIFISEVRFGADGFIELANPSSDLLDIGFWSLKNETTGNLFLIPEKSKIGARSTFVLAEERINLLSKGREKILLLYPNNTVADSVIIEKPVSFIGSYKRSESDKNLIFTEYLTPGTYIEKAVLVKPNVKETLQEISKETLIEKENKNLQNFSEQKPPSILESDMASIGLFAEKKFFLAALFFSLFIGAGFVVIRKFFFA